LLYALLLDLISGLGDRAFAAAATGSGVVVMAALNLSKNAIRGVLGSGGTIGEIGELSSLSSRPRGMNGVDLGTTAGLRMGPAGDAKSAGECGEMGEYDDWLPECGERGGVRAVMAI
jgi:hypothetical protein